MNFKLSKYLIQSDKFSEPGDQNEYSILFSCRKKMGIKMNIKLINLLNLNVFNQLPDNIFSMLMHYEIIIPEDENEELHIYNTRKLLYKKDLNAEKEEKKKSDVNLDFFLQQENETLKKKISKKEFVDLIHNNLEFSFIFSGNNKFYAMNIDEPELYRNPLKNRKQLLSHLEHSKSYLLPLADYGENISPRQLNSIIENFKLKLMLKYKIEVWKS